MVAKNPNDVRVLLEGFLATIDRLSLCFPEAKYSQKLASKETNDMKKTRSNDQFFENSTKAVEQDLKITFEEKTISDASY